jgi:hypothetical protein
MTNFATTITTRAAAAEEKRKEKREDNLRTISGGRASERASERGERAKVTRSPKTTSKKKNLGRKPLLLLPPSHPLTRHTKGGILKDDLKGRSYTY